MEVNLYHILFIVLICLGLGIGFYPKKIITKTTKSVSSLKKEKVLNLLETVIVFVIVSLMIDLNKISISVLSIAILIYLKLRDKE